MVASELIEKLASQLDQLGAENVKLERKIYGPKEEREQEPLK